MPTTPPHVRMPTSGPIFISLTLCEKMSPSEPACSLVSVTTGPATASSGYVPTLIQREWTLLAGGMDEQCFGRRCLRQRLAVDGDDALADLRLDADRVERRIGARIPRVAACDLGDLPAAARVVPACRRGEVAERHRG